MAEQKEKSVLRNICEQYIKGAKIDWYRLYEKENVKKIRIPVYPFEKTRCWFDIPKKKRMQKNGIEILQLFNSELEEVLKKQDSTTTLVREIRSITEKWTRRIELDFETNQDDSVVLIGKEDENYTEKERAIAQAWSEVLGIKEIGIGDDFFELGGDSLIAIQMISRLKKNFDVVMNDLYEFPTIEKLAQKISFKKGNLRSRIEEIKKSLSDTNQVISQELVDPLQVVREECNKKYHEKIMKYEMSDFSNHKKYKNILLTGATGFLGIYLLHDLLKEKDCNVHVILRGDTKQIAKTRLLKKIEFYFGESFFKKYQKRIFVFNGDLTKEKLNLTVEEYEQLSKTIDCIIHSAANTSHYGQYSDFYNTNVEATKQLLDFAKTNIRKDFQHISTMAVTHGRIKDKDYVLFTEDDCDLNQKYNNFYARTKFEAEKLFMEARKEGLLVNIFRVGIFVQDSLTGKFQENIDVNRIYRIIKSFVKLGVIPEQMYRNTDFSFVDYVSKSIILLFDKKDLVNETYHIQNPYYISFSEILTFNNLDLNLKTLPVDEFLDYILTNLEDKFAQEYIEILLLHLGLINARRDTESYAIVSIGSDKTNRILAKLGFEWEEINAVHMEKMINYCKEIGMI